MWVGIGAFPAIMTQVEVPLTGSIIHHANNANKLMNNDRLSLTDRLISHNINNLRGVHLLFLLMNALIEIIIICEVTVTALSS
jgi:hypothetical protein